VLTINGRVYVCPGDIARLGVSSADHQRHAEAVDVLLASAVGVAAGLTCQALFERSTVCTLKKGAISLSQKQGPTSSARLRRKSDPRTKTRRGKDCHLGRVLAVPLTSYWETGF